MAVDEQYAKALREVATLKLAVRILIRAVRETQGGSAALGRLVLDQPALMAAILAAANDTPDGVPEPKTTDGGQR